MSEHTNATTPATSSQHSRTNEGACESGMERDFEMMHLRDEVASISAALQEARREIEDMERALAAEQAAHALTKDTYETGAKCNAAVVESLRARITDIVDAVKAERVARAADQDEDTRTTYDALRAAEKHTDAMVRKHAGAGVSESKFDDDGILGMLSDIDSLSRDFDKYDWGVPVNMTPQLDAAMCEVVRKWLNGDASKEAK